MVRVRVKVMVRDVRMRGLTSSLHSISTPLVVHMHISLAARLTEGPITPYSHLASPPTLPQKAPPRVTPTVV